MSGVYCMADNFQIDGLVEQRKELESLMMSNPETEKKVQKLIRKVLLVARRTIAKEAKGKIKADPRQAYKAVKTAVYKRILGGSVSILNKRGAARGKSGYEPPKKLKPGQWGGNRVARSRRTQQVMDYQGADRAFILRFLELGTYKGPRIAGTRGGVLGGNRGQISPRHFFGTSSHQAMEQAAEQLSTLIDEMIKNELR